MDPIKATLPRSESIGWAIGLLADLWLGLAFWNNLIELIPNVYYYSLKDYEITWWWVFLSVLYSPVLLGFENMRRFVSDRSTGKIFYLGSLIGMIGCYLDDSTARVVMLAIGCAFHFLAVAGAWVSKRTRKLRMIFGFVGGLMLFSTLRWSALGINMFSTSLAANVIGNILNGFCIVVLIIQRRYQLPVMPRWDVDAEEAEHLVKLEFTRTRFDWISFGFSIGALLFQTHFWLSGPTVVIRFTGIDSSPIRNWNALLLLVAGWIGLVIVGLPAIPEKGLVRSDLWYGMFAVSIVFLSFGGDLLGFLGALLLFFSIPGLWFIVLDALDMDSTKIQPNQSQRIGKTMFLAVTVYLILLGSALGTLAFEYLPLGQVFKWFTVISFIAVGLLLLIGPVAKRTIDNQSTVVLAQNASENYAPLTTRILVLLAILLVICCLFSNTLQRSNPAPADKEEPPVETFTVASWNIQQGFNMKGQIRLLDSLKVVNGSAFISLQESDLTRFSSGSNDAVLYFSERMAMFPHFGPPSRSITWGVSLLSKWKLKERNTFFLKGEGDAGLAIVAICILPGNFKLNLVIVHTGSLESDLADQIPSIIGIVASLDGPVILMGTLNILPNSSYITSFRQQSNLFDAYAQANNGQHPATSESGAVDYVFYTPENGLIVTSSTILDTEASNHNPVFATFKINRVSEDDSKK